MYRFNAYTIHVIECKGNYLNTTHVSVQCISRGMLVKEESDLNTTHVSVQSRQRDKDES